MLETIQQAVKHHDKYQIEIKLDYELLAAEQTRYNISTYIFVPQNLGITPESYPKHYFYRDVQSYIRLKTPSLNLREISDSERSPLCQVESLVRRADWTGEPDCHERVITQLKLLSATLKSAIREHFNLIERRIQEVKATPHGKAHPFVHNLVEEYLAETDRITGRFRALLAHFNLPNVPEAVFSAYTLIDESISILIEENAVEMFQVADEYLKKTNREELKHALTALVNHETRHRKARGYLSILAGGAENENYLYRASALKKYASSVLFLKTDVKREGERLEHVLFALAAGISMLFATLIAFYFQYRFGNLTLPFFVALVVGYMFKDRIKEIGRMVFARQLEARLFDRSIVVRTQDGRHKLGIMKEKVRFVREADVPASVLRARNRDQITDIFNEGRGEKIICYTKDIVLYTDTFAQVFPDFPEITGINDILRYDIRHFLNKMAEPVQERYTLVDGELQKLLAHKVYHLNLITRFKVSLPHTGKINKRLRIVLNQKGIKRIEHVQV